MMPYDYYESDPRPLASPKTTDEARAIWASMDERGRLLMAKTAPKVAGKWEKFGPLFSKTTGMTNGIVSHKRRHLGKVIGAVYDSGQTVNFAIEARGIENAASVEAAKSAVDAKLRELGYVLEDE